MLTPDVYTPDDLPILPSLPEQHWSDRGAFGYDNLLGCNVSYTIRVIGYIRQPGVGVCAYSYKTYGGVDDETDADQWLDRANVVAGDFESIIDCEVFRIDKYPNLATQKIVKAWSSEDNENTYLDRMN